MKKCLLILSGLLIQANCFAATISIQPFISGNDVAIDHLESQRSTLQNFANGNVEGGGINIKAGSITSQDQAVSISMNKFRDEAFNDWTVTGMLPVTSVNLTSATSLGISYINGVRVETAATNHSYTASKDTYVYINAGGSFDYQEVANGASAPSTPTNDLLLAKVVTSVAAVTSVADMRTLSIQITANSSNLASDYRNQALVVRDSTTAVHTEPGQVAIGNTFYTNTADSSSKSTATSTNWIEGSVPNLNNQLFYVYAYNNAGSTFDFKYASADPVYSDSSLDTGGTLRYYVSGGTTYRALGWISADSTGTIQTYNFSNFQDKGIANQVNFQTSSVATGTVIIPDDDTIPAITEGDEFMNVTFRPTNANHKLLISAQAYLSSNNAGILGMALFQNTTSAALSAIQQSNNTAGTSFRHELSLNYIMTAGTTSPIIFRIRCGGEQANTTTFNGVSAARKYGGVMNSFLRVREIED